MLPKILRQLFNNDVAQDVKITNVDWDYAPWKMKLTIPHNPKEKGQQ